MRRTALRVVSLSVVAMAVAGCGGGGEEKSPSAKPSKSTASPSATTSASALPAGCAPLEKDVEYTDGTASLDITSGPGQGHYDLALDADNSNEYAADDSELTGQWLSADDKAVVSVDVEGTDPCKPDAFTRIGTEGVSGAIFVDSSHTACTVELPSLGDAGAQGTFTCKGLTGGGEGVSIDAHGTFTLLP